MTKKQQKQNKKGATKPKNESGKAVVNLKLQEGEKAIEVVKKSKGDILAEAVQKEENQGELSLKFQRWVELFTDKSNPKLYGNKTQCALAVYDTDNYASACSIGYQNFRKLQFLSAEILEKEGFGYAEMMKIGMAKVMSGTFGDWDKMMERCGYFQPKSKDGEGNNTFNFENLNIAILQERKARGLD